jgi:hypothetical protein
MEQIRNILAIRRWQGDKMMTMLLMLLACVAAWALVGLMLSDARLALVDALRGQPVQGGGWMPSSALLVRSSIVRPVRALTRA